jgi:hypothetical protein
MGQRARPELLGAGEKPSMPPRRRRDREEREEREERIEPGKGPGRDREVYLDYLRRRWQGSAPPTPQAYARALSLWSHLPGALPVPPTEPGTARTQRPQGDGGEPAPSAEPAGSEEGRP